MLILLNFFFFLAFSVKKIKNRDAPALSYPSEHLLVGGAAEIIMSGNFLN